MGIVLPHFASQNEVKRCPFKIIVGSASRQMKSQWLFTQPQDKGPVSQPLKKLFVAEGGKILFTQPHTYVAALFIIFRVVHSTRRIISRSFF
jgi:hypothetical protein